MEIHAGCDSNISQAYHKKSDSYDWGRDVNRKIPRLLAEIYFSKTCRVNFVSVVKKQVVLYLASGQLKMLTLLFGKWLLSKVNANLINNSSNTKMNK